MTKKTAKYFKQLRIDALRKRMSFKIYPIEKGDLSGIVNIDRAMFPHDLEMTLTPSEIIFWFNRKKDMFRVAKTPEGDVIGFTCVAPLSSSGSRKMFEEEIDSFQDLASEDIDDTGEPKHVHAEVIATLNPNDIHLGAALLRTMFEQIPGSCEIISAAPITIYGQQLIDRLRFTRKWKSSKLKDGSYKELYILDLTDPQIRLSIKHFLSQI